MASKISTLDLLNTSFSIFLFLIPLLLSLSNADTPPPASSPVSTGSICKSTPDPTYCKSVLPSQSGSVYYYGRFSVRKALSQSRKFLQTVEKYLNRRSTLTQSAIRALEDCSLLAGLNIDFLQTSFVTVSTANTTLPTMKADDVQTELSAILTNQQTCLDGLQATSSAWSLRNGLSNPLANDTKLYSMSLALFTKGWVPKKKKSKTLTWQPSTKQLGLKNGHLPLKMSGQSRAVYEKVSRRKVLEKAGNDNYQVVVNSIVVVSQDGSGNFTTITDAISAAPNNTASTNGYFLIYVTAGIYEEYVSIAKNKRYVMMIGDGINQTIITGNRSVVDGWTTFNSATFAVVGPGFVGVNMTIRNTAGAVKHQAVALRNSADLSTFYSCSIEGYQDTLYTHSLRQFYRECDVYGTVDFIFGNAAVVLQNCNLYPRLPMANQFNAITAQGRTDPNQNTGTSIHNCTIKAADELAMSNMTFQTYLGRPWKLYSRTVFMQNYMDSLINSQGWRAWDGDFALATLYYAEYNNSGPGSNASQRVNWSGYHVIVNSTDASNFTVGNFILGDDWLPQTGVPYTSGLIS